MNILSAIGQSVVKTAIVAGTAVGVPLALSLTSATPTGGFAVYLSTHPSTALVFGLLAMFAHNYLSQVKVMPVAPPPAQVAVTAVIAEAVAPVIAKL